MTPKQVTHLIHTVHTLTSTQLSLFTKTPLYNRLSQYDREYFHLINDIKSANISNMDYELYNEISDTAAKGTIKQTYDSLKKLNNDHRQYYLHTLNLMKHKKYDKSIKSLSNLPNGLYKTCLLIENNIHLYDDNSNQLPINSASSQYSLPSIQKLLIAFMFKKEHYIECKHVSTEFLKKYEDETIQRTLNQCIDILGK